MTESNSFKPPKRQYTEDSTLQELETINQNRRSLVFDEDYDDSKIALGVPGSASSDEATEEQEQQHEPIKVVETNDDSNKIIENQPKLKLVRKTTDKELYELKTKITVDNKRFKDGLPKSKLTDVKFSKIDSIMDHSATRTNRFAGFFVLFWLAVAVVVVDSVVNYIRAYGLESQIVTLLLTDLFDIAFMDLLMYLSIYFAFILHSFVAKGFLSWSKSGWIILSFYEFIFLVVFMSIAEHRNFPWIGKIFLFLHQLVLLMKMHSYGFYNGYLWRIYDELKFSRQFQKKNEDIEDDHVKNLINESIEFCEFELQSQSNIEPFPTNINLKNFFNYTMFPTLIYQIEYPRTERIRWSYVGEKLCAIFGIILLMIVIAQNYMYPLAIKALELRTLPLNERILHYPLLLLNIMPSFLLIYILVWYLIWDAILNCIAELSKFGDRDFYGDWWNCVSWDQFAREWNIPVHKFLLRHVYHSSISALRLSKTSATIFTFLLSSIVHEMAMYVLFHKMRGYLLLLQMFQLPLVAISKTKYLKERRTLGNIIFWVGIASGPSVMCTLYLTF
ncbi:unnamed protein product [Wickerhamomyces anomalus]